MMHNKGFTLIELLVVIAIIGVLSALLMSNFIGVRQRARDAQRKSDIRQIQSALELYRADYGQYPTYSSATLPCGTQSSIYGANPGIFSTPPQAGDSVYMQTIPCDPLSAAGYIYNPVLSNGVATGYTLTACLENSSDSQRDSSMNSSCSSSTFSASYTVTNP